MSDTATKTAAPIHIPSDHERHAHDIPAGKHVAGHRVVIKGTYYAKPMERGRHGGGAERTKRPFTETVELPPSAAHLHPRDALARALPVLADRLSKRDKEFRGFASHTLLAHLNILIDAPEEKVAP